VSRLFQAASGNLLTDTPIGRSVFGRFQFPAATLARSASEGNVPSISEDLVVGLIASDDLEIHCHGGKAAALAVCDALIAAGAIRLTPAAWIHQQQSDTIAAAALALADTRTERAAAILLDQYRGALRRELVAIDRALAHGNATAAHDAIQQLLTRADLGLHLTQPWKVVIAGRPNAGKSSLMNAILGYERSIVWREPGTTRDVLTATTAIDGWPIELTDTAGLRVVGQTSLSAAANPASDFIESEGIARALCQIAAADVVLFISDTTAAWDNSLHLQVTAAARRLPLIVHNKRDLTPPDPRSRPAGIATSALTGQGIDELCCAIAHALIPSPPAFGIAVPFTADQIASLQAAAHHLQAGQLAAAQQLLAPHISKLE